MDAARWRLLRVELLQDGGDAVGSAVQGTGSSGLQQRRLGPAHLQLQGEQEQLHHWRHRTAGTVRGIHQPRGSLLDLCQPEGHGQQSCCHHKGLLSSRNHLLEALQVHQTD